MHLKGSKNKNKTLFIKSTIFIIKKIWGTELNNNPKSTSLLKARIEIVLQKENFSPYNVPFFFKTTHSPLHIQTLKKKNQHLLLCLAYILITFITLYFDSIYAKNNAAKSYTELLYHTALNISLALTILDHWIAVSAQRCPSIKHFPFINCWKFQST